MLNINKDPVLSERNIPFGLLDVRYPEPAHWDVPAFRALVQRELSALRSQFEPETYDRKAVFGENPYVLFFKKFKKTYPVMLQFESVVLKSQPFPKDNPIREVPFLLEMTTLALSGTHDIAQVQGEITLCSSTDRTTFMGLAEREIYTYPGDVCGRDEGGVIFSSIAGGDLRTRATPDSRHVFYPVFGTPDMPQNDIQKALETLEGYVKTLAPGAETHTQIL